MPFLGTMMELWRDTFTVRRVFGDPVEKDGLTMIPVAMVAGGGGGGVGPASAKSDTESSGGGFGGLARPVGVYVVRADGVEWQPTVDVTMLGMAGIGFAAILTLMVGRALKRRR